jgi:hypothetical protein
LDWTGVVFVDAAGKYLLALMHMHNAGARFVASGCLMGLVPGVTKFGPKYPHRAQEALIPL